MLRAIRFLGLVMLACVLVGCTSTVTNLSARQQPRTKAGLYTLEASWDCNDRTIRKDTIQAYVLLGNKAYPMQRTPLTPNRWEGGVPLEPGQTTLNYRFKFEYEYDAIPVAKKGSRLSPPYQVEIIH